MRLLRRRSSTSDTTKFREKLQSLSKSVERQENLVTESPREGQEEEMDREAENRETGVNGQDVADYPSNRCDPEPTGGNSANNNGRSVQANKDVATATSSASDRSNGQGKMLNLSEKVRDSTSSGGTATSVYSVGFDL